MLRAQVISQQNMRTENQNIVTMCHIKIFKNSIKIKTIRYFLLTKISDIYIGDIYQANPVCSSTIYKELILKNGPTVDELAFERFALLVDNVSFHSQTMLTNLSNLYQWKLSIRCVNSKAIICIY